jgi:hypothetical protein
MRLKYKKLNLSMQILLVACIFSIVLVMFLLSFSANQVVKSKNAVKEIVNRDRSFAVIEKVDRNFYERFGDVQAFSYNRLAIEAIDSGKATIQVQDYLNTMVSYYVLYDVMMIVSKNGKVVAVNTRDKDGFPLKSQHLVGKDFSNEPWFINCTAEKGPEGAWYSDFIENPFVGQLYGSNGRGVAFASPIKNDAKEVIGVWYNFASWKDVTQGIRSETEASLNKESAEAFVIITDKNGRVIDAADESLILHQTIDQTFADDNEHQFQFMNKLISADDYIVGTAVGKGAYTYKGNDWIAFTFVRKEKFSLSIFFDELFTFTIGITIILAVGIWAFFLLSVRISNRIKGLQQVINAVSRGELFDTVDSDWRDEIGQMTNSLKQLIIGLKKTSVFANEIGKGNFDGSFQPLSEKDVLGHSLVIMSKNLRQIKVDEEKRKWISEGLAAFGNKLRSSTDIDLLCDEIIKFLSNYIKANQGAIFLAVEDKDKFVLSMKACYAWDRKKYIKQKIEAGEGIIGQAWKEGEIVYLRQVPDGFIKITSGLGECNPSTIIILPLKQNDEILGVMELAFFSTLQEYEIEFLKKVSDAMAATLGATKINEQTKLLLIQSQQQTMTMRSQEEEMRQNLEELTAIQEEMSRKEKEYIDQIKRLENGSHVFSMTKQGTLL